MIRYGRFSSGAPKVLVIAAAWTLVLLLMYTNTYFLVGDLVGLGKLSGSYDFWPDFLGNAVLGAVGGLLGGSALVFKLNAGYRHRTFASGIALSGVLFVLGFVALAAGLLYVMSFAFNAFTAGVRGAGSLALANVAANLNTPSFFVTMAIWGVLVSATQFMLQVNDKFGPGVLWKLVTGRYYRPRREERIFMFLDLRASTEIAERLGSDRFFGLLRELFQDVTPAILDSGGEIYQYVGDEVVITWPVARGVEGANCIACFFRIGAALAERRESYEQRFGVAPRFKAGVHMGPATVGEIGVIKKDIVFSGDVLNTTSRIQDECNRHQVDLLVSSTLLERLGLDAAYQTDRIGEIQLRGKAEPVGLSAVTLRRPELLH